MGDCPYSNLPLEIWIEFTMSKDSKNKIGLVSCAKKLIKYIKTYNKLNAVRNSTNNFIRENKTKIYNKK